MKAIFTIILTFVCLNAFAQHTLTGKVIGADNAPLPYAAISLRNTETYEIKGIAADSLGNFKFNDVSAGKYILAADYVGHSALQQQIEMPDNDFRVPDIILQQSDNELDAIEVKGRRIVDKDDRKQIYPSQMIKTNSNNGYTALAMMLIPGLKVDVFENKISSHGSTTLICINGRPVTEDEVKTLNPIDIRRVDYYQGINPKFPSASSVVDFIMDKPNQGASLYLSANQYLNRLSGDDVADLKIYKNKSEFNVQVSGDYNHFETDKGINSQTNMLESQNIITKDVETTENSTHENSLSGKFSYLYYGEKNTFNVSTYVKGGHSSTDDGLQQVFNVNSQNFKTTEYSHDDNISPAAKVFYEHHFDNKQFVRLSLYGSYNQNDNEHEYMSEKNYKSKTSEDYYFLNPEVLYGMPLGNRQVLFTNIMYFMNDIRQKFSENGLSQSSTLNYSQGIYMLGDAIWLIPQKFNITVQLSDRVMTIDNGETNNIKHYFSPDLFYKYRFGDMNIINGNFSFGIYNPYMGYYSRSQQHIDEYQITQGDPNLKTSKCFTAEINYQLGPFETYVLYERNTNSLFEDVEFDNSRNLFVHTIKNGGNQEHTCVNFSFYNDYSDELSYALGVQYDFFKERTYTLQKIGSTSMFANIVYTGRKVMWKIEYSTRKKKQDCGYLQEEPMALSFGLGYNLRGWNFMLNVKNPWIKVYDETEYNNGIYSDYSKYYQPKVNYDAFRLSVSYRFNIGRHHNYQNIEMDNSQKSGILKRR